MAGFDLSTEAIEDLHLGLGPRISAQWEHLGTLQALMLVWVSCLIEIPFIGLCVVLGWYGNSHPLVSTVGYLGSLFWTLILVIMTGLAYRNRNAVFAREVAMAELIMQRQLAAIPRRNP